MAGKISQDKLDQLREAFGKVDFQRLTLDTNNITYSSRLSLSDREVTWDGQDYVHPWGPSMGSSYPEFLCSESLTGRCYWEVEWSGRVGIEVTYRGISRKGYGISRKGYGPSGRKSWRLFCGGGGGGYYVTHNREQTHLPVRSSNVSRGRVAVYLDHPAGTLSFYEVSSDTLTHLYTFQTTFTEPLYAGFRMCGEEGSVRLCEERFHADEMKAWGSRLGRL